MGYSNYPANIWLVNKEQFNEFILAGGKVIYIVEEPEQQFSMHPSVVSAGALLPPIDAIQNELDGFLDRASMIYEEYLKSQEADSYISIILAAAIKEIPIGIMFGSDELNMKFPEMFINFVYRYYGLVIGVPNKLTSYIEVEYMPFVLAKLYNMNIIDYATFMTRHPQLPIHQSVIPKLAYDIKPLVKVKDMQHYTEYFESFKNSVFQNNGRMLIDPFLGVD